MSAGVRRLYIRSFYIKLFFGKQWARGLKRFERLGRCIGFVAVD